MILIVVETLDAELGMKESPIAANIADRLRRRRRRKARKAASRIKATASIANVTMIIVQAAAMKIHRPRRQIQKVILAIPIMLILLDSSTAHRVSAEDSVHHLEIDRVHLLVAQHKEANAQQNQLERVMVSYILPVIHQLLRSPWQTRCFIHQG